MPILEVHDHVSRAVDFEEAANADDVGVPSSHENASLITRAVGPDAKFEMETVREDVISGDQFLLASDGLTRVVQDQELLRELTSRPPQDAADTLITTVMGRGAPDNVSIIIIIKIL